MNRDSSQPRGAADRREFLRIASAGLSAAALAPTLGVGRGAAQTVESAEDANPRADSARHAGADVKVLLPQTRVPLSFIIDDSTCLVNMGHFCTPQFAAAWPDREIYQKPWREWPREIPDAFVREFGEWCADHGVKGKYSIVPNPACVGWLDRALPGWSRRQLHESLELVRELMLPNWDIHPEMITHTRVIDLETGRPLEPPAPATMENSYPQEKKSVDELAAYLAYALTILKNCGLPCEGITTPGGFGSRVKEELPRAVDESVRDVFGVELPHYFKYVRGGDESTEPVAEFVRDEGSDDVRLTMNVPAGTGDWFGGWQGDSLSEGDRYLTEDGSGGRMAELIRRGQPAVMLCHWPGMYSNGSAEGFQTFQRIVRTLADVYGDRTLWMKVSEIGRYWAAKRVTTVVREGNRVSLSAPFATERFTVEIGAARGPVSFRSGGQPTALREVATRAALQPNTWLQEGSKVIGCFDLPKGTSKLEIGG